MNKQLNEIISAVRDAIEMHNLQNYWECLHYEVLPFLERLIDKETNQLIQDTMTMLEQSAIKFNNKCKHWYTEKTDNVWERVQCKLCGHVTDRKTAKYEAALNEANYDRYLN